MPGGGNLELPDLPGVPSDSPAHGNTPDNGKGGENGGEDDEEIDFDDLTRRFEALKKKK